MNRFFHNWQVFNLLALLFFFLLAPAPTVEAQGIGYSYVFGVGGNQIIGTPVPDQEISTDAGDPTMMQVGLNFSPAAGDEFVIASLLSATVTYEFDEPGTPPVPTSRMDDVMGLLTTVGTGGGGFNLVAGEIPIIPFYPAINIAEKVTLTIVVEVESRPSGQTQTFTFVREFNALM